MKKSKKQPNTFHQFLASNIARNASGFLSAISICGQAHELELQGASEGVKLGETGESPPSMA